MFSITHDHLPGPPGTLFYHLLLHIEGRPMLLMRGTPQTQFTPMTYATLDQAIYSFGAITTLIKDQPPGDPVARQACIYLLQVYPLILGFPKGGGDLGEFVADPHVMGSPLLNTAEPCGLVLMKTAAKRYVVHDVVKEAMPGIEEIKRADGSVHYSWAQVEYKGPKAN